MNKISKISLLIAAASFSLTLVAEETVENKGVENTLKPAKTTKQPSNALGLSAEDNKSKEQLLALLAQFESMSANFSQEVKDVDGVVLQQGEGTFVLSKPNFLFWHTTAPDESTITSDGETLWLFDPFIEQATAFSLANSINNTPLLLLMNQDEAVWSQYKISSLDQNRFAIESKEGNSQVKSLLLTFAQQQLASFTISDVTGQQSQFVLSEQVINPTFNQEIFTFNMPEGAVLDDQR